MGTLLYNRTCFSLQKSTLRIEQLKQFASENGYQAIGICDQNVLYAAQIARNVFKDSNIKVIYGLEIVIEDLDERFNYLVYAKNDSGFNQLARISSLINVEHRNLSLSEFQKYDHDLIVILLDTSEDLFKELRSHNYAELQNKLIRFKEAIPEGYLGYSRPNDPIWLEGYEHLTNISTAIKLPLVALSLALYEYSDDFAGYKALMAVDQNLTMNSSQLRFERDKELLSPELLMNYPAEALANTDRIAAECKVTFTQEKAQLPVYDCPKDLDSQVYLTLLCKKGLEKRFNGRKVPAEYHTRLNYELDVIGKMGFSNYFLIVYDFILFARHQKINVGPGRGSAPGSLVAYCLGITHVDPIRYGLLFERFLNPERTTMPDIDTDFEDDRREEVIDYLKDKYGSEHVAHISAFGTFGARQAIQDIAKVLDLPAREVNAIKRSIPNFNKITLSDAYKKSPSFQRYIDSDPRFQELYRLSSKIECLPRNLTTHAAGIVLSKDPLMKFVPLVASENQLTATQYSYEYLEALGLIKMDLLGIINLTIIGNAVNEINKHEKLDILKIPLDDEATFSVFKNTDTLGIFQSESDGMKALLKKMQPNSIQDIALTFALYRPGPMQNIDEYLRRRNNPSLIVYPHPALKPVLEETCGIIIYQEQIMQVSQIMAGFSLGKADILRKAMSKKKVEQITALKNDFINGCLQNGYDQKTALEVYQLIEKFASYGFNKSHSIVYAFFAYQMAYLKAHYPIPFYRSLLNNCIGKEEATAKYLAELKKRRIKILGPDLNHSGDQYLEENMALRFPLTGIKSLGTASVEEIIKEREKNGEYLDYCDAILRLSSLKIGKAGIGKLIDAGAFDCFKLTRSAMNYSLQNYLQYADIITSSGNGQISFDRNLLPVPGIFMVQDDPLIRAEKEKSALGFYFSEHPLSMIREESGLNLLSLKDNISRKGWIKVLVQISKVKQHRTKNGELMAFITAGDETGSYDFVFMPDLYNQNIDYLVKGQLIVIEGVIDDRDSCLVKKVLKYESLKKESLS